MTIDSVPVFDSILTPQEWSRTRQSSDAVHDLALDQVFARLGRLGTESAAVTGDLLVDVDAVMYRQGVFRGLQVRRLRAGIEQFLSLMNQCAQCKEKSSHAQNEVESRLWHLHATTAYLEAVGVLHDELSAARAGTMRMGQGWELLSTYLDRYVRGSSFVFLSSGARAVDEELSRLRYSLLIDGPKVTVAVAGEEQDLGEIVTETFQRFRRGMPDDHRRKFGRPRFDHVQAWILELVAGVHADPFTRLTDFVNSTESFEDERLVRFGREVQFYLSYLDYVEPMLQAGLPLCFPILRPEGTGLAVTDAWDISLARRLTHNHDTVVLNDISLTGPERILVVSGPNQGGKTTMARMFGQLHYLAALGCPVPARSATITMCDRLLTMFEREERLATPDGRLATEVQRLAQVFATATARSVIVVNEAFASTAMHDARVMTADVLDRIAALGARAVCVTFIDEMSRLNESTVSMVSAVDPDDPARRTFRVERRVADGRAYARALAAKHGLTATQIRRRFLGTGDRPIGALQ